MSQPTAVLEKNLLKSVSRSFYLSIRVLPAPLRPAVGVGYLLCRAADTIADTNVIPVSQRLASLEALSKLMKRFPVPSEDLRQFISDLNLANTIPRNAEGQLLQRFPECIEQFNRLPRTSQAHVQKVVLSVISGMTMDLKTFGERDEATAELPPTAFKNVHELEQYLLWIGGEPGNFWTAVTLDAFPHMGGPDREYWRRCGEQFGTGLQMVNILRDLTEDLKRGRCYIPETLLDEAGLKPADLMNVFSAPAFLPLYHRLIDDALERLQGGVRYIEGLPRHALRLRSAIWWPLVFGLRTLGKLRMTGDVLGTTAPVKISRKEVYQVLALSVLKLPFNGLLRNEVAKLTGAASSSAGWD